MNEQLRDRAFLPLAIPLGALVVIALVTILMSRVLLNVPKEVATAFAISVALSVLIGGAVMAMRPRLNSFEMLFMTGAAGVPVLLGLAVALGAVEIHAQEHATEAPTVVKLSAQGLAFEQTELRVPAESEFELEFTNKEAAPHNVVVNREGSGEELFKEPFFAGPKTVKWTVPALPVGTHPFKCEVHPNMTGTMVATKAETGPGEETSAAETVSISANDLKFDTDELELTAEKETKLEFNNLEAAPHNVAISETEESTDFLFREPAFPGPKKVTWVIPPLKAGTYAFKCEVHPSMKGRVVVT